MTQGDSPVTEESGDRDSPVTRECRRRSRTAGVRSPQWDLAVAQGLDDGPVVGDDEHRHPRLERPEELAYLVPRDGVEVGGDFVQDHHLRPARERPRQGETLELASRELGGIPALPAVGKADEACALLDAEPGSLPFGAEPGGRLTARPLDG